jgi:hypothetical protein
MAKAKRTSFGVMLITVALAGCAGGPLTTREMFTYGGGALGAGTGAIIGAASGSAATGAAIGGPVGAIGGFLIGDSLQGGTLPIRGGETRRSNYSVGGYSRKVNSQPQQHGEEEGGQVF